MPWKIRRFSRWRGPMLYVPRNRYRRLFPVFIFAALIFIGFQLGARSDSLFVPVSRLVIGADLSESWQIFGAQSDGLTGTLAEVLPVASFNAAGLAEDEAAGLLIAAIGDLASLDLSDPKTFFAGQVAHFDRAQPVNAEPEYFSEPETITPLPREVDSSGLPAKGEGPLVAIYCTHSAECYVPSQGTAKMEGKNGGVFSAATELKNILENKYQIPALLSATIHDYPDWAKSYANSLKTLQQMKAANPSVIMFIDIHRDATTTEESTTVEINGEKVAKLMFVVGSDARLPHPSWRENWQYASRLAQITDQLYPGLIKGVRVQDGRYNQHISTHCLLLEVGGTENTLEEAKKGVAMLAEAINLMITNGDEIGE